MKKLLLVSLSLAFCTTTAFACNPPASPSSIPDGKSATMDQMMSAKKTVDQFKKDMETYLGCTKDTSAVDSAQAALERVASRFNAEVRAYKAASGGK
jgi:hypothetical protein